MISAHTRIVLDKHRGLIIGGQGIGQTPLVTLNSLFEEAISLQRSTVSSSNSSRLLSMIQFVPSSKTLSSNTSMTAASWIQMRFPSSLPQLHIPSKVSENALKRLASGALLEQRWASQEYKYTGEAACIAIPDSLNSTLIPRTPGQFTRIKSEIKAESFGKPSFFYNWVAGQSSTMDCQVSSHTLVRPEMLYTEIC